MYWYIKVWKNFLNFRGRAHRKEFWTFWLINAIISIIFGIISHFLLPDSWGMLGLGLLGTIYLGVSLQPSFAVGVRRLRDTNRPGIWAMIGILPVVGLIWLLIYFALPGDEGDNRYGVDPKTLDLDR